MSNRDADPDDVDEYFDFIALLNAVADAAAPHGKSFTRPFLFKYGDEEAQVIDSGTNNLEQATIFDDDCYEDES